MIRASSSLLFLISLATAHAGTIRPRTSASPIDANLRRGFSAIERGKLPDAETAFRAELQARPKRVEAMLGLAELARLRKEGSETAKWIRDALAVEPKNPLVLRAWARHLSATGRHPEAASAYRQAAALEPKSPVALIELGESELAGSRVPTALSAFREAVARAPDSYEAQMGLGATFLASRKTADATEAFLKAAAAARNKAEPHFSLGLLYAELHENDRAIAEFSVALKMNPLLNAAYLARGDIYQTKGDYRNALSDYSTVARTDFGSGASHLRLGFLYLGQNNAAEAEKSFQKAVDLEPRLAQALNNLAWLAAEKRSNLDKALEWAKKAVSLEPKNAGYADTLAWVYRARREFDLAAKALDSVSPASRTATTLYHEAVIEAERGRKSAAVLAAQKALATGAFPEAESTRRLLKSLRR